ncbi:unnamed protein product [Durusdinium trenchii]|uniref:Uncharacterized protein n=2 Tax=Durusdinium trenchii TaxID=1381693 RepID=A0ABP0MV35_9DINO
MALGQLHHLETLFINSGWLAAQCESFNTNHAWAIQEGSKFQQAPNLYALDTFVVTPMSKPGTCAAREQDVHQTIPCATGASSFSELVNPNGLYVHCFVSHFWGHLFSSTLKALDIWAQDNFQKMQSAQAESLVFWICLFALNQHDVAEEVGENPRQSPFNAALAQAKGGGVMVLDEDVNPFKRVWCLFEISRLKDLQRPFELISALGSLSKPVTFAAESGVSEAEVTELLQETCKALWEVSMTKAQSSVEGDKYLIWAEIADCRCKMFLQSLGARVFFDTLFNTGGLVGLSRCFSTCDHYVRSLLSTSMLQIFLTRKEYVVAAECCCKGALFTEEQLSEICASFTPAERATWLNALLMEAAELPMAKRLLEHGADVEAADSNGDTVLMSAARSGHESVAKLLLERGADAGSTNKTGSSALMFAALGGHESLVRRLLEHGADAGAANNEGTTSLMGAAYRGHESIVKLLLSHGANPRAADHAGNTSLMHAALAGHELVAKLLLKHGADVRATTNNGDTALRRASQGGHKTVARLLLENGADETA